MEANTFDWELDDDHVVFYRWWGWEGVWQTTHIPEIPLISKFIYKQM